MAHGCLDEDGPWVILGLCPEHLPSFPFVVLLLSLLFLPSPFFSCNHEFLCILS